MTKKHHKTIVLSDLHLGSKWSKAKSVTRFLKKNSCDTLILCGDIIDGWNIMRGKKAKWKKQHTTFIKLLLDIQHHTRIIYIRGNHDDFLDRLIPIHFQNIEILKDYIYNSNEKNYYVTHGDIFDSITSRFSWLAQIGDVGYTALLWINKLYNNYRIKKGLPYYSLSREIKNKVKVSVSYMSDFEKHLTEIARKKKCEGVICGHIHHAEIKYYQEIHYLNSGDWVESLSALTEDYEGNWQIVTYDQFLKEQEQEKRTEKGKRKTNATFKISHMRYLFIVQGEGRGHMTQAIALSDILRRHGHEVCEVLLGKSKNREVPEFFTRKIGARVRCFDTLSFKLKKNKKHIHLLKTILYNADPVRIKKYMTSIEKIHKRIEKMKPDAVINFYEILCGLTNIRYRENVPFINIGHQFLLNHPEYQFGKSDEQGYMFLRLHAILNKLGATKTLALSFYPLKDYLPERIAVVPPLLRKEILEIENRREDYILIYIVNHGYEEEIREWHRKNPAIPLICFWDKKNAPEEMKVDETLTFFTINDEKFLYYMAGCKAYVSTAGFESICEAFYLSKPVMVIPSHIEQEVNAADASSTGKAIAYEKFDLNQLLDNLKETPEEVNTFSKWVESGEELFMRHLTTFV